MGRESYMTLDEAERGGRNRSIFLLLLIYTGLFAVMAAAVYFLFLYEGRTFLRFGFRVISLIFQASAQHCIAGR